MNKKRLLFVKCKKKAHEFQSKFHLHVQDFGMRHRYIKARTP